MAYGLRSDCEAGLYVEMLTGMCDVKLYTLAGTHTRRPPETILLTFPSLVPGATLRVQAGFTESRIT